MEIYVYLIHFTTSLNIFLYITFILYLCFRNCKNLIIIIVLRFDHLKILIFNFISLVGFTMGLRGKISISWE